MRLLLQQGSYCRTGLMTARNPPPLAGKPWRELNRGPREQSLRWA
jgi:hypothetical protein